MKSIYLILICLSCISAEAGVYGLNTINDSRVSTNEPVLTIENMPKVRSQDSVGLCASFAAATLIDEANCSSNNIKNCSGVPDSDKASPLDLARYSEAKGESWDDRLSYDGIKEGGWTPMILQNSVLGTKEIAKESCAPFDQVTAGVEKPDEVEKGLWNRFKKSYEKNKAKEFCATCEAQAATVQKEFELKSSNHDILEGFAQDTYNKFLDRILIPSQCWDTDNMVKIKGSWDLGLYPMKDSFSAKDSVEDKRNKTIAKIKEVLGQKRRPLSIDYCAEVPLKAKSQKNCKGGHAVVIKGYRKVCKIKEPTKCRNMFQIQNSWGQKWQDNNDNGWVDGDELLNRTFFQETSLSWLEPKPIESAMAQ